VAERTIVHWETGRNAIPAGAADELMRLNAQIERSVLEVVDLYVEQRDQHGEPDVVALTRYRTAEDYAGSRAAREGLSHACHNALTGRTMTALERIGVRVAVAWHDRVS
jgi:hypothetical protein